MPATLTAHAFKVSWVFTEEESGAVKMLELVPAQDGTMAYDALIQWRSSEKTYRFAVEDDATAAKWFDLLSDPEARSSVSWGSLIAAARRHGDIEAVEV
jgi:hypothetical protein